MNQIKIKYAPEEFVDIQQVLGERPGNYHIDPHYLRRGFGNKAFLWENGGWRLLKIGDVIIRHGDGTVEREKVSA